MTDNSEIFQFDEKFPPGPRREREKDCQPPTEEKPPLPRPVEAVSDETNKNAAKGGVTSTTSTGSAELSRLKMKLYNNLAQYQDFPTKGVLFEDIMPLFAQPQLHKDLISALQILVCDVLSTVRTDKHKKQTLDVIVGLESRGFLVGPTLAYKLDVAFVPVRKQGKLPGPCETEGYEKEYGADHFQMQKGAIKPGQRVIILDDIIATGMLSSRTTA